MSKAAGKRVGGSYVRTLGHIEVFGLKNLVVVSALG